MVESRTKCLIVDDEPLAVKVIQSHLEKVADVEVVGACHSALDAFEALRKQPVDLVFLDIQMPHLTGIEFIRALERPPSFIFTTAYRDYALEGFELDAVDYLLKPVSLPRLLRALDKYRRHVAPSGVAGDAGHSHDAFLTVRANRQNVKINLADVLFIESLSDYTRIHTTDRVILSNERISQLAGKLASQGFLRIHRSFVVSLEKITSYTAEEVYIGDRKLPVSRSYRQAVRDRLN